VIASFTLGSLLLATLLILITYGLGRSTLMRQRQDSSRDQFFANALQIQEQLRGEGPDFASLLLSLPRVAGSESIVRLRSSPHRPPDWNSPSVDSRTIPAIFIGSVLEAADARRMRFSNADGEPQLAFGLRLQPSTASELQEVAYFEIIPLKEINDTLRSLAIILLLAAVLTVLLGAGLGVWAGGRLLQPLGEIGAAARSISKGHWDTRVDGVDDPDLNGIVRSFNEMAASMQERIARDARFASDVSHELRSPLMTIRASVEVMQHRRDELSERSRQALQLLSDDIDRFEQMVQDLLDISRSDSGSMESIPLNIVDLVVNTVSDFGEDGITVAVDPAATDSIVLGDKRRLHQVVANLLTNASKYAQGATSVKVEDHGDCVRVVVEDAGPGVSPSERTLVFERFTRGAAARRRGSGDGTGLGLALVDEHVRRHGGSSWVNARPDGESGAHFVVELPKAGRR